MEICNYKIAKKLKEKGFPQSPDYYNYSSYYDWDGLRKIHSLCNASVWFDPNISRDNIYFAPTISQVLKWLRNEKDIFLELEHITRNGVGCNLIERKTGGVIASYKYDKFRYANKNPLAANTYEKCALDAIQYVLDNLI